MNHDNFRSQQACVSQNSAEWIKITHWEWNIPIGDLQLIQRADQILAILIKCYEQVDAFVPGTGQLCPALSEWSPGTDNGHAGWTQQSRLLFQINASHPLLPPLSSSLIKHLLVCFFLHYCACHQNEHCHTLMHPLKMFLLPMLSQNKDRTYCVPHTSAVSGFIIYSSLITVV